MTPHTSAGKLRNRDGNMHVVTQNAPARIAMSLVQLAVVLLAIFYTLPVVASEKPERGNADTFTPSDIAAQLRSAITEIKSIQIRTVVSAELLNPRVDDDEALVWGSFFRSIDEFAWADEGARLARTVKFWKPRTVDEMKARRLSLWHQSWLTQDGDLVYKLDSEQLPGAEAQSVGASIQSADKSAYHSSFYRSNVYLEAVGSFFYDGDEIDAWHLRIMDKQQQPRVPFSLPDALDERSYDITSRSESLNGINCWLLESDHQDKLWLAPDYGFALVQREWRFGPNQPLMFRFVNSDFKQISPGLWLPLRAERFNMARLSQPAAFHNIPHFAIRCDLTDCTVNDAPDELFVISFPPGTVVVNGSVKPGRQLVYNSGTNESATAQALERAVRDDDLRSEFETRRARQWVLIVGANIAALVVGCIIVYMRKRK